jgi:hypothetical protein
MMLTVCSHQVLIMFPMFFYDVLQVPIVFPNTFPRAPHFYPIWFGSLFHLSILLSKVV